MRKYILIHIGLIVLLLGSCKKKMVESIIVKVPSIELIDLPVYSTSIQTGGGTYTDPGVLIHDESAEGTYTVSQPTSSNVDLTTPGFYTVNYTITTKYQYVLNISRLVLVTNVDSSVDISGTYVRTSNQQEVHITKVGTGLYKTDNVGGVLDSPENIYDIYFGFPNDTTLVVPPQYDPLGDNTTYCDNTSFEMTPTTTIIKWVVENSALYKNSVRTFIKQN